MALVVTQESIQKKKDMYVQDHEITNTTKDAKKTMINRIDIAKEVTEGSVRPCDECGRYVPFNNPDATYRICRACSLRISE